MTRRAPVFALAATAASFFFLPALITATVLPDRVSAQTDATPPQAAPATPAVPAPPATPAAPAAPAAPATPAPGQVLADGTIAPDFTVQDRNGKAVRLSDYKGKTVVLDFWATWCGPCQMSLPHTNAIAAKYMKQNVVFLAINVSDTKEAFQSWLPQHKSYTSLKFAIDPAPAGQDAGAAKYGVTGIPTQFVIAPSGKIAASFVGFDPGDPSEQALQKAIKSAQTA